MHYRCLFVRYVVLCVLSSVPCTIIVGYFIIHRTINVWLIMPVKLFNKNKRTESPRTNWKCRVRIHAQARFVLFTVRVSGTLWERVFRTCRLQDVLTETIGHFFSNNAPQYVKAFVRVETLQKKKKIVTALIVLFKKVITIEFCKIKNNY